MKEEMLEEVEEVLSLLKIRMEQDEYATYVRSDVREQDKQNTRKKIKIYEAIRCLIKQSSSHSSMVRKKKKSLGGFKTDLI